MTSGFREDTDGGADRRAAAQAIQREDGDQRESAERSVLERAVANARNGIIITDNRQPDNPIIYTNESFLTLTGYSYGEIIGRNCRFLQGPDTDPAARQRLREAVARGEPAHLEILNYRKDGTRFWNDLLISPLRDRDGQITHFVGNQIDTTARKEAELALSRERGLLEGRVRERTILTSAILTSLPAHIAVLDHSGSIIAVNEAWDRFAQQGGVQITEGAYIGVSYLDTLRNVTGDDAEDSSLALAGIESVLARQQPSFSHEYPCAIPGLGDYWFLLQVVPLRHDGGGAVVMHLDITERKLIERRKDDFISMASHELKTPVTGLQLGAQVLERRLDRLGMADEVRLVGRLRDQIGRLGRLVDELLDVSRINVGKLEINPVPADLVALTRETAEMIALNAPDRAIEVVAPARLLVEIDRDRIAQVVINLLSNAIKYSPAGSPVGVAIEARDGDALLSVSDQGMGIDPAYQERIFDRFYQVPVGLGQTFPGLGMGLYITGEIVKRHHGRIWVESKAGEGATFRIALPLVAGAEDA